MNLLSSESCSGVLGTEIDGKESQMKNQDYAENSIGLNTQKIRSTWKDFLSLCIQWKTTN